MSRNPVRDKEIVDCYMRFGQSQAARVLGITRGVVSGVIHRLGISKAANDNTAMGGISLHLGRYYPDKHKYVHHDERDV
jgi:hypothetical protein